MSIEAPLGFWLALTLPVILVLWLLRPRRVLQRVPSLFLWRGSEVERKAAQPWQRLRNDPLLWLQLLIASLLVAAAVRPFLPAAHETQHTVVLLDASGSMRATDVAPDRFGVARQQVLGMARALARAQRLTVIRVGATPSVIAMASSGQTQQLEQAIAAHEPGYGPADLAGALALAEGVAPDAREWLLVSDGGLEVPAGIHVPDSVSFRSHVVVPPRPAGNVAVTGLRVRIDAERTSVQASVRNFGGERAAGRLVLLAESAVVGAQDWTLEPGTERHFTWTGLAGRPEWLEARLADVPAAVNVLAHDDQAWTGIGAQSNRRVLLVSDGNTFIERVLAVLGGVRADRVATAGWEKVAAATAYDVVILDGTWPSTTPPHGNLLIVGPPAADSFAPARIQPTTHPLVQHVDWSDVNIAAAARLPNPTDWDVIVRSAGQPLLALREPAGRREAVLAFRLASSDLPLRPAFPVLMANLLDWLAPRSTGEPLIASPGAAVRVDAAPRTEMLRVERSDGTSETLAPPWPPAAFRPAVPGIYRIIQEGPSLRHERLLIASGYAPSEAALMPRPLQISRGDGVQRAGRLAAWSLWPLIAVVIITFALVEWWVDARGR